MGRLKNDGCCKDMNSRDHTYMVPGSMNVLRDPGVGKSKSMQIPAGEQKMGKTGKRTEPPVETD